MSTASVTAPRPRSRKKITIPTWVFWVGLVLLAGGILFFIVIMFGRMRGEEFSPHNFKRRSFHYYQIPIIGVQVWPIRHFDATGDLETKLNTLKLLATKTPDKPRWDLVQGSQGSSVVAQGYALILCRYLDTLDSKRDSKWLKWTEEKPKLAEVFWPHIARLADQELYFFVPDLFELAETATDRDAFEAALKSLLANRYHDFGMAQLKMEKPELAVELLAEAVKLAPDNKAWQDELTAAKAKLPK